MANGSPIETCQVLDGEGRFQEDELAAFIRSSGLASKGVDYQVVAIMGPQSSGKSTLMNHVFGTTFLEMDAQRGRQQTTKGVWLARSPRVPAPATLVLDLEGTDGRERGEDDTNFERQSALFALAVADVLLVNIWCHDIGREQASGKPLLKTIFQVNLKLFTPEPGRRRTVLLFVIRDKSKTPLDALTRILEEDLGRMWASITKPPQYADTQIDHFFELQYAALHSYEDKPEDFLADTVVLRRRFTEDGEASLVRDTAERLPADTLALSTSNIWRVIKSQKDLNLPAHKVMVANIRCAEIKADQLRQLQQDQAWRALAATAQEQLLPDFGPRLTALLESCMQGYDMEAGFFDASVRAEHRAELVAALEAAAAPPYAAQLALLVDEGLDGFRSAFAAGRGPGATRFSAAAAEAEKAGLAAFDSRVQQLAVAGTQLTPAAARATLAAQMGEVVAGEKKALVGGEVEEVEEELRKAMAVTLVDLLAGFRASTWPKLHAVRTQALADAQQLLSGRLQGLDLTKEEGRQLAAALGAAADKKLGQAVQEAALTRVGRMKDAFHASFACDDSGTPRSWRVTEDIPALARQGRAAAAQVLAGLAVQRGADYKGPDAVESAVLAMAAADLGEQEGGSSGTSSSHSSPVKGGFDLSTASSWPGVAKVDVLLSPAEVRAAWREFMSSSALSIQQAQLTQAANRAASRRAPPVWALGLILLLGWNELTAVLWNPLYWLLAPLLFLVGWQLYSELDVDAELERGVVAGGVALWSKTGGALRRVAHRNMTGLQHLLEDPEGAAAALRAASPIKMGQESSKGSRTSNSGSSSSSSRPAQVHKSAAGLTQRKAVQMTELPGSGKSSGAAMAADTAPSS